MKKLKDTIPNGGVPLGKFPILKTLFDDENKDAIEALLNSVLEGQTQGVILSGCDVSGSAGNFAISAGFIYADGEVLRYNGGSGFSATRYLKKGTVTEISDTFADRVSRAFADVNEAADFSATSGGSGTQYVTVTFASGGRTLSDRIGDIINDGVVTTAKIASNAVTLAKMAANSVDSDQYVDGSIDTVHIGNSQVTTAKIADDNITDAKLAPLPTNASWTNLAANSVTNITVSNNNVKIYEDGRGVVWIKGKVDVARSGATASFIDLFNIPSGLRPDRPVYQVVCVIDDGVSPASRAISIATNGNILIPSPDDATTDNYSFDFCFVKNGLT